MERDPDYFANLFSEKAASAAAGSFRRVFGDLRSRCESPIEEAMLAGLIYCFHFGGLYFGVKYPAAGSTLDLTASPSADQSSQIHVQPQIGPYRTDFAIIGGVGRKQVALVIECDGHDFHERTKEQAQRDRSRDRWMTSAGATVLRFTGSEIWRDATVCAYEVVTAFDRLLIDASR